MKIKLLKPLFLLLGLLFVVSCQEDFINEENISTEQVQNKRLILEYKTIDYVIKEESALRKSVQKIQQNKKDLTSSVYNFSFDENKVQIMQDSTYTQYTFLIKRDNPTNYMVENYICRVYENDSVQQFITSYPVIETQDSLEIDYSSGNFQEIQDDVIDISKLDDFCVPTFEDVEVEVVVFPCSSGEGHEDPDECDCGDLDSCEPPLTMTVTETIVTWDCGGGESDSGDDNSGPDNNDPGGTHNGGGNGNSNPVNDPVLTDPVEPELLLKLPVREYFENLDDDKKDCYENSGLNGMGTGTGSGLNSMIDDIKEFLNENTTNGVTDPEAQAFADAILEDCDSSQEVDFEEKIINGLDGKVLCVYNKIKSSSTGFKDAIKKFESDFPVAHLKFEMVDLGSVRGQTIAPNSIGANTSPNYVITIQLNNNNTINGVSKRPNLLVAKTIIHEVIHAEMYRKLLSVLDNGGNIDGVTRQDVLDALNTNNFPGIYDYFRRYKNWQHAQMASHYRETIAKTLQEYNTGAAVSELQQPAQFYMDLAWEGLRFTNIPTWNTLPGTEKDRINNVISNYITSNENQNCIE